MYYVVTGVLQVASKLDECCNNESGEQFIDSKTEQELIKSLAPEQV